MTPPDAERPALPKDWPEGTSEPFRDPQDCAWWIKAAATGDIIGAWDDGELLADNTVSVPIVVVRHLIALHDWSVSHV